MGREPVERTYIEIAVLGTVPSPVHPHQTLRVVTVKHESVASACRLSAIKDWATVAKLAIYNVHPLLSGEVVAVEELDVGIVREVLAQGVNGIRRVRAAAVLGVGHLHRHAAMEAYESCRLRLGVGVGAGIVVKHVVPVVSRLTEVCRKGHGCHAAAGGEAVRARALAMDGILVVEHDLRHGGGDATYDIVLVAVIAGIHRREAVVRCALSPRGSEHLRNFRLVRSVELHRFVAPAIGKSLFEACIHLVHPPKESGSHFAIARVFRIAEHGREVVVVGNHGKSAALSAEYSELRLLVEHLQCFGVERCRLLAHNALSDHTECSLFHLSHGAFTCGHRQCHAEEQ